MIYEASQELSADGALDISAEDLERLRERRAIAREQVIKGSLATNATTIAAVTGARTNAVFISSEEELNRLKAEVDASREAALKEALLRNAVIRAANTPTEPPKQKPFASPPPIPARMEAIIAGADKPRGQEDDAAIEYLVRSKKEKEERENRIRGLETIESSIASTQAEFDETRQAMLDLIEKRIEPDFSLQLLLQFNRLAAEFKEQHDIRESSFFSALKFGATLKSLKKGISKKGSLRNLFTSKADAVFNSHEEEIFRTLREFCIAAAAVIYPDWHPEDIVVSDDWLKNAEKLLNDAVAALDTNIQEQKNLIARYKQDIEKLTARRQRVIETGGLDICTEPRKVLQEQAPTQRLAIDMADRRAQYDIKALEIPVYPTWGKSLDFTPIRDTPEEIEKKLYAPSRRRFKALVRAFVQGRKHDRRFTVQAAAIQAAVTATENRTTPGLQAAIERIRELQANFTSPCKKLETSAPEKRGFIYTILGIAEGAGNIYLPATVTKENEMAILRTARIKAVQDIMNKLTPTNQQTSQLLAMQMASADEYLARSAWALKQILYGKKTCPTLQQPEFEPALQYIALKALDNLAQSSNEIDAEEAKKLKQTLAANGINDKKLAATSRSLFQVERALMHGLSANDIKIILEVGLNRHDLGFITGNRALPVLDRVQNLMQLLKPLCRTAPSLQALEGLEAVHHSAEDLQAAMTAKQQAELAAAAPARPARRRSLPSFRLPLGQPAATAAA